ncbi:MAG: hypothetical protein U0871_02415 [Gemmataceae bacterium]
MSAYLVQYGRSAFVGRFTAETPADLTRGDRVVVRTPRGLELGHVLGPALDRFAGTLDPSAGGQLIRQVTEADAADADRCETACRRLLTAAEAHITSAGLPATVLDAEVLLDGATAALHVLPWAAFDGDALAASLSAELGLTVRLHDVSRTPTLTDPPTGCGKPGCGSGEGGCSTGGSGSGGGCSTGGCSRGSVKSADELTAYFADLRAKMEESARRTSLH